MFNEIFKTLKTQKKVYIVTHQNPDGDALGSSFALKFALESMNIPAEVVLDENLPVSFKFTGWEPAKYDDTIVAECVVGLDFNDISRAGDSAKLFDKAKTKIIIDHHLDCKAAEKLVLSQPSAAATGELIFKLLKVMDVKITSEIAQAIYIAIMTDTGGCRYSNTTSETHLILSEIVEKIDHAYITRMCLEMMPREKLEIHKFAVNNLEFFAGGTVCAISIRHNMIKNEDLLNGIVNFALNIEGVKAGILFKEKEENKIKVSFRTFGDIDAREMCAVFGGGGHKNAAGCTIEKPLEEAKELFIKVVSERI